MLRTLVPRLACLAAALVITAVFFIDYCSLIFGCGCQSLWAGGTLSCNIHAPSPPHCPWCLRDGVFGWWSMVGVGVAQAGIALGPGRFGKWRAVAVFAAFPLLGGIAGLAAAWHTNYF